MKTLITIEVENEIGNPSVEDVEFFVKQIIEKGLEYCPISGISLRLKDKLVEVLWGVSVNGHVVRSCSDKNNISETAWYYDRPDNNVRTFPLYADPQEVGLLKKPKG